MDNRLPQGPDGRPGFIQRELDRIGVALETESDPERHARFYAAQQALAWATDPDQFATPTETILHRMAAATGTPAG